MDREKVLENRFNRFSLLLRWLAFFFFFYLIWVFMFVIAPWIQKMPAVQPLADFIEQNEIDAGALFYTEVAETAIAESAVRNSLKFTPTVRTHNNSKKSTFPSDTH